MFLEVSRIVDKLPCTNAQCLLLISFAPNFLKMRGWTLLLKQWKVTAYIFWFYLALGSSLIFLEDDLAILEYWFKLSASAGNAVDIFIDMDLINDIAYLDADCIWN